MEATHDPLLDPEVKFRSILFQVMVMNLSRMLSYDWLLYHDESGSEKKEKVQRLKYGVDLLLKYYSKYKTTAEHDQKLLNIMFHFNPGKFHSIKEFIKLHSFSSIKLLTNFK